MVPKETETETERDWEREREKADNWDEAPADVGPDHLAEVSVTHLHWQWLFYSSIEHWYVRQDNWGQRILVRILWHGNWVFFPHLPIHSIICLHQNGLKTVSLDSWLQSTLTSFVIQLPNCSGFGQWEHVQVPPVFQGALFLTVCFSL